MLWQRPDSRQFETAIVRRVPCLRLPRCKVWTVPQAEKSGRAAWVLCGPFAASEWH